MGIDIYQTWPNMTDEEEKARFTGFNIDKGEIGYLREAYHGSPYATKILVPEAFDHKEPNGFEHDCMAAGCKETDCQGVQISAATLRARLPAALDAAIERERTVYHNDVTATDEGPRAFTGFVELAERKEAELGVPVRVYASY